MGNSASKTTRVLNKSAKQANNPIGNLKKQVTDDHLRTSKRKFELNDSVQRQKSEPKVFTERPPKELEKMGDEQNRRNVHGNLLFEEAVSTGVVQVNEHAAMQHFDSNHESIQVLKNRVSVEKQYDGLYIPKDADKPDTPDRFLTEEQRKQAHDPELISKRLQRTGVNSFGLFDSKILTDLIADYKVFGENRLKEISKDNKVEGANVKRLQELIDQGLINLPTHKVTLHEGVDQKSRKIKQKLVVVKDDWVRTIKEDIEREKSNNATAKTTSKKDQEVFEQFKMLENLVSKSQIYEKETEGPMEGSEVVMNRPRKQVGKEIKNLV
jgi:hypothetical protein